MFDKHERRGLTTQVLRHFTHSAETYHCGAQLQRYVGEKLLSLANEANNHVLDLGAGPGLFTESLSKYSGTVVSLDLSRQMLSQHQHSSLRVNADSHALPFSNAVFDMVFSSLMIQWCDFQQVIEEILRVLKPGQKAVLSTLVSGSLVELEQAWGEIDNDQHIHEYLSELEIAEALRGLKCTESRVTNEPVSLYFDSVRDLAKELKQLGANYVKGRKSKGLMTRRKWQRLEQCYADKFADATGRIPATYQVLFIELVK